MPRLNDCLERLWVTAVILLFSALLWYLVDSAAMELMVTVEFRGMPWSESLPPPGSSPIPPYSYIVEALQV